MRAASSVQRTFVRAFSAQAAKPSFIQRFFFDAPSQPTLVEAYPDCPAPTNKKPVATGVETSTLSNGLRVVSRDDGGQVASFGIYFKAGSRYEAVPGTNQLLEALAFSGTQARSGAKLARDAEDVGASISAKAGREVFTYSGRVLRDNVEATMSIISDAVSTPHFEEYAVREAIDSLNARIASESSSAEHSTKALFEGLHAAAFGADSALGHALYAVKEGQANDVDAEVLRGFLGSAFTAANAVVVANNVKHAVFVDTCDKYLLRLPEGVPTSPREAAKVHAAATFLGGESISPSGSGGLAHVAIGLPAPSTGAKDAHALGVLAALLGSANAHNGFGAHNSLRVGPAGQSRLARSAHTEAHSFIRSLAAFSLPYSDAGIVGIAGSCADHEAGRLVNAIAGFLKDAASVAATAGELERAKKAYKLSIASAAEAREGARDALGRTLATGGAAVAISDVLAAVDKVTAGDVQAVAAAALKAGKPAISAVGGTGASLPRYDQLKGILA